MQIAIGLAAWNSFTFGYQAKPNLQFVERFSPELCKATAETHVYAFGDNLAKWGKAGQACIRYELNAIGIPTKHSPYKYFTDSDLEEVVPYIDGAILQLKAAHLAGKVVVFPKAGIGTGLAKLPDVAPSIYMHILHSIFRVFMVDV